MKALIKTNAPIRIMRLTTRLAIGGPGLHTVLLTERLNRQRFETELVSGVALPCEGSILEVMDKQSLPLSIVTGMGREIDPRNDMLALGRLMCMMRRYRPHIVHTHTAKAGFLGRIAAHLMGVPVIVHTFHGNVFHGYFSKRKTGLIVRIEQMLSRITDRIIVLSEQQQTEIRDLGIGRKEQFRIVPLGLDLERFLNASTRRGVLRQELGIAPDTPIVGIVARLVPIKAVHLFIEAIKQVQAHHPHVQFVIVGDGESRLQLEALARQLEVTASLHFLGFRSDLPDIYADLDCVALCSYNEGLPVAIIEALASARPVVATDVGSVRTLITPGVTGCLVPAGDVTALANGIVETLNDPRAAAGWGRAGQERVYPYLDTGRLVADIESLYFDVLQEKHLICSSAPNLKSALSTGSHDPIY